MIANVKPSITVGLIQDLQEALLSLDKIKVDELFPRELYLKTSQQIAKRSLARINSLVATYLASGRCLPIVDDVIATGTAGIGVSALEYLGELKVVTQGKVGLVGNHDGIGWRRWTAEQVETKVKRAIAQAWRGGGFILSDNHGEIPWQVPDEVQLAIGDAVERWGRYPLDWLEP